MVEISQNVNIEMLEKLPDGTYKRKYPKTRSDTGVTFDAHLADDATDAHLAKNIGLEDVAGNFTASEVEGALSELFTNVSNGKNLVGGAITGVDPNVVIPTDPTFQQLVDGIGQISTSPIKSIQRGVASYTGTTLNINISPVNIDKSIVKIYHHNGNNLFYVSYIMAYLLNETTIRLETNINISLASVVNWEVIEFIDSVNVQKGLAVYTNQNPYNLIIGNVDISKSMFFMSQKLDTNGGASSYTVSGGLTQPTTVTLLRNAKNSIPTTFYWYVVEIP